MLARKTSESESDFEILQEYSSSSDNVASSPTLSDLEGLEASFSESLTQRYSLTVEFENKTKEKLKKLAEDDTIELWNQVIEKKVIKDEGDDQHLRPLFVNLQAASENAITSFLKSGKIRCSVGIIHTPTPATPLRADPDPKKIEKGVVTKEIEDDPKRLETVTRRAEGIRKYLEKGGTLYSVYKNENNEVPGMQTFKNLIRQYPNNLFAEELDNVKFNFPTGATYLFGNDAKYALSFSIDMTQANLGSSQSASFGYACVDLNKKSELNKVEERLEKINNSLRECNIDMIEIYRQKVNSSLEEARVVQPFRGSGLNIV
ncbi:hypothetical protein [Candidatus Mesenet endosymbiont of Phosphuga atrata]|uniref:hypothetical protein n=1 Tax=Candidatus Mesenet endosymbiont of Phosphuga atrata TaxID=3066221 RepID=UPI0030D51A73